ncbi:hypothetical protein L1887_57733 [Cichorium endivia]|nr:hypothetical protein L1887_57733 [Cichorium endivia]
MARSSHRCPSHRHPHHHHRLAPRPPSSPFHPRERVRTPPWTRTLSRCGTIPSPHHRRHPYSQRPTHQALHAQQTTHASRSSWRKRIRDGGVASASTSRANSPEKSRKPATQRSRSQASVSPLVTAVPVTASEVPTLVEAAQPSNQANSAEEQEHQQALTAEDAEVASSAKSHESGEDKDVFEDTEDNLDTPQDPHPAQSPQPAQTEPVEEPIEVEDSAEAQITADEAGGEEKGDEDDDGFDDFGEPAGSGGAAAEHDDFGDFDDFETGDAPGDDGFGDDDFENQDFVEAADTSAPSVSTSAPLPLQAAAPTRTWTPLDVTPTSNRLDLAPAVSALLPLSSAAEKELTNTALRQVEGAAQVLVSGGSREMWTELSSVPSVKPIDWVRSKTRRDYLISMGVPVNLDEIHSSFDSQSGRSGQLPPLQLKYDSGRSGEGLQRSSSLKLGGHGGWIGCGATLGIYLEQSTRWQLAGSGYEHESRTYG